MSRPTRTNTSRPRTSPATTSEDRHETTIETRRRRKVVKQRETLYNKHTKRQTRGASASPGCRLFFLLTAEVFPETGAWRARASVAVVVDAPPRHFYRRNARLTVPGAKPGSRVPSRVPSRVFGNLQRFGWSLSCPGPQRPVPNARSSI
jgi:hypothetical protein